MTTLFVVLGALGFGLLLIGLFLGDMLDLDVDSEIGSWLSVPVVGSFLGAFGVGGLLVGSLTDDAAVPSLAGGTTAGVALAFVAARLTRSLMGMPTDATPASGHYMGQIGRVITAVSGGRGEVMLRVGGSPQKLAASADVDIERGVEVVVIEVLSASAVRVIPVSELLEEPSL